MAFKVGDRVTSEKWGGGTVIGLPDSYYMDIKLDKNSGWANGKDGSFHIPIDDTSFTLESSEFKVAQKVKFLTGRYASRCPVGSFGIVEDVTQYAVFIHVEDSGTSWCFPLPAASTDLEIIGTAPSGPETNELNKEPQDMSALTTIRAAKLTQTDRVLQGDCLEAADGTVTSDGQQLMLQKIWEENRVAYAKELIAAKKVIANEQAALKTATTADEKE